MMMRWRRKKKKQNGAKIGTRIKIFRKEACRITKREKMFQ
jgi:hypothetical protein